MADKVEVPGRKIELSEGRHVFVSKRAEDFLIEFKNKEGELHYVRLGHQAAEALWALLSEHHTAVDFEAAIYKAKNFTLELSTPERRWEWVSAGVMKPKVDEDLK